MPSNWFQTLAGIYVPLSIATAVLVLADIFLVGRRQRMAVMEAVWPLTMLYWGPLGLVPYAWFGRAAPPGHGAAGGGGGNAGKPPMWQASFNGAGHCGAGCALGDFIGDWAVFATGFALFGSALLGSFLLAFLLAYAFGIAFQYFAVVPMRNLGLRDGLIAAVKIDTFSLLAYEVGMFAGWASAPGDSRRWSRPAGATG